MYAAKVRFLISIICLILLMTGLNWRPAFGPFPQAANLFPNAYASQNNPIRNINTNSSSFSAPHDLFVGKMPHWASVGDFNDDGNQDIVTANNDSQDLSILLGKGDGTFKKAKTIKIIDPKGDPYPSSVAVGDFDNDGKPDLVSANRETGSVSLFIGKGDGTFVETDHNFSVGEYPNSIRVADFNNDKNLDLVVANSFITNTVTVLFGDGHGNFNSSGTFYTGERTQPYSVVVGDFNNDGNLDMATANYNSNSLDEHLSILLGDGRGNFSLSQLTFYYPNRNCLGANSIAVGDFNNDGKPDLALALNAQLLDTIKPIAIFPGNGDGTFMSLPTTFSAGITPFSLATADFNGDNRTDIAIANLNNEFASILTADRTFSFASSKVMLSTDANISAGSLLVAVGDFNNDKKPDLAIVNNLSNKVSILLNTSVRPIKH